VFCFNLARKNREKSGFFSHFSKLERFLRELPPIEEYSRKTVGSVEVKQHPVILDPQPAHLELVNFPRITQHCSQPPHLPRQPEHALPIIDIRGNPTPAFRY
jgi:hypothetical protein